MDAREDARAAFAAAVAAADPAPAIHRKLARTGGVLWFDGKPLDLGGRNVWLLGAGKAAASMAAAVEDILGDRLNQGLIVTKYGHGRPLARTRIIEAGHPFPDDAGRLGATTMRDMARQIDPGDLLLCVWSGGGSALLPLPVRGLDLADLRVLTDALLRSGCTLMEMNTIRRHLCALSGGRLAALCAPATIRALVLSDVIGNDLSAIASGPTAPDPTSWQDCANTISRNGLEQALPESVLNAVERGLEGVLGETPKPGDPVFTNVANVIISDVNVAVEAAARELRARGWKVRPLRIVVAGEARDVGRSLAERTRNASGIAWVGGGETTVTIRGTGTGGRCQELALSAAIALDGGPGVVLAAGTDGTDGPTDAAGAIVDGGTASRARAALFDPVGCLKTNDAYGLLGATGDRLTTGPTGTNVMDVVMALSE